MQKKTILAGLGALAMFLSLGFYLAGRPDDSKPGRARVAEATPARTLARARNLALPEDGPPAVRGRLCGRVVDAAGNQAVEGATVSVRPAALPGLASQGVPRLARTDAGGRWQLAGVSPRRAYAFTVSHPGFAPASGTRVAAGPDCAPVATTRLQRGGVAVRGRVRDAAGGFVPAALVRATRVEHGAGFAFRRAPVASRADDEGRFELWLPRGAHVLQASQVGYATASGRVTVDRTELNKDFSLFPASRIVGQVVDGDGRGVEGAWVAASPPNGATPIVGVEAAARAGAQGAFEIDALSPGRYQLVAYLDDAASKVHSATVEAANVEARIELELQPAYTVAGVVLEEGEETPVADAVVALSAGARKWVSQPSLEDGSFTVTGLPAGSYMASVFSEEHPLSAGQATLEVERSQDDVVLHARPGVWVTGTVTPSSSQTKVWVRMDPRTSPSVADFTRRIGNSLLVASAGQNGDFRLGPAVAGALELVAEDPQLGRAVASFEVGPQGLRGADLRLEPGATLRGTVTATDGTPVDGASVCATEHGTPSFMSTRGSPGGHVCATTGPRGGYELVALAAGKISMRVHAPGRSGNALDDDERTLTLAEGVTAKDFQLDLRRTSIAGRVTHPGGEPAIDVRVEYVLSGLVSASSLTAADGTFELEDVESPTEGSLVRAYSATGRPATQALQAGVEHGRVDLELPQGHTLRVSSVPPHGELSVHGPDISKSVHPTDGEATFRDLGQGTYQLEYEGPDGYWSAEVDLRSASTATATVGELSAWSSIEGVLVDPQGTGMPDVPLVVQAAQRAPSVGKWAAVLAGGGLKTRAGGTFTCDHVRAGKLSLYALDPNTKNLIASKVFEHPGGSLDLGSIPVQPL